MDSEVDQKDATPDKAADQEIPSFKAGSSASNGREPSSCDVDSLELLVKLTFRIRPLCIAELQAVGAFGPDRRPESIPADLLFGTSVRITLQSTS